MLSSKEKLKEAEKLFEEEKYFEALKLLNELEQENPGEKRVAYGRAMCLAKLGHVADAMLLCDELLAKYKDEKAKVLKEKIMQWAEEARSIPQTLPGEKEAIKPPSKVWIYTQKVLWALTFITTLLMPVIGWWGLMTGINKDWISVSFGSVVSISIIWPLFIQALYWSSIQALREQPFGDTPASSIINWFLDIILLTFFNIFPVIGWILGAWWLTVKRDMLFSASFALMILNHFILWLAFLGIVASIGIGGWAWVLAPLILRFY